MALGKPPFLTGGSVRQPQVLLVPDDPAVAHLDDAAGGLAGKALGAGVPPFALNRHQVALGHHPREDEGDVGRSGDGLAAELDEGFTPQDRRRHARRPVDDLGGEQAGEPFPVALGQRRQRGLDHLPRGHARWNRWRPKSSRPTTAAPIASSSTAAADTSLARPMIGCRCGQAWSISTSSAVLKSSAAITAATQRTSSDSSTAVKPRKIAATSTATAADR